MRPRTIAVGLIALSLLNGCGKAASTPTKTPIATASSTPAAISATHTSTPVPPSATPTPSPRPTLPPSPTRTSTPIPPTRTPLPPTPTPLPPTDTVCALGCDYTSVQAAIDDLSLAPGAVLLLSDPVHTEAGIVVDRDITLRGLGVELTVLQAHEDPAEAPERVLLIKRNATVVLEDLTIRHGVPSLQKENGGGVRNFGSLTLRNCLVTGNTANGGGGVSNSGSLTLIDSTVSGNTASGVANMGEECGNGGGIHCGSGTLTLVNSTVSGNLAGTTGRNRGGGVFVGCGCTAVMTNTTISDNLARHSSGRTFSGGQGLGGGVYVQGALSMVNCTVTGNSASSEASGVMVRGHLDYQSTIIAGNVGRGSQCVLASNAVIGENGYNLVEGGGSCSPAYTDAPMLGPLGDNGGATLTHALLPGSMAIDLVPLESCPLQTDQRNAPRPAQVAGAPLLCDLGAYEWQP